VVLAVTAGLALGTHRRLSATVDEPVHVVAGMEWLERGTYRLWPENPPLSRIADAVGPYLGGVRLFPRGDLDLPLIIRALFAGDDHLRTFAMARQGVLVWLLASVALLAALGALCLGGSGGLLAAALFASLPPVLAHGGLATTDVPALAAFLAASLALVLWTHAPSPAASLALGAAVAAALCAKFSSIGFLLVTAVALAGWLRLTGRPLPAGWRRGAVVAAVSSLAVTWVIYRFSLGAVAAADSAASVAQALDQCLGSGSPMRALADRAVAVSLPAPELFRGALDLCAHNAAGHSAYALGRISQHGFWYYFPLALAVKTPIPFLILVLAGVALGLGSPRRDERCLVGALAATAAGMLVLSMASSINIGIRHVLPIYAPLAILAACGARGLWSIRRPPALGRLTAAGLAAAALLAGPLSFPDFLPYFNALAGPDPSRVLLDSDLDWGQDLLRLEAAAKRRGIEELHVAYFGTNLLCDRGLPARTYWLQPGEPTKGWIAISEMHLKGVAAFTAPREQFCDYSRFTPLRPGPAPYAWLEQYRPVELVGRSIRLYHVP
jgi:hypothetical protein